jgi:hypothetical protein
VGGNCRGGTRGGDKTSFHQVPQDPYWPNHFWQVLEDSEGVPSTAGYVVRNIPASTWTMKKSMSSWINPSVYTYYMYVLTSTLFFFSALMSQSVEVPELYWLQSMTSWNSIRTASVTYTVSSSITLSKNFIFPFRFPLSWGKGKESALLIIVQKSMKFFFEIVHNKISM